MKAMVSSEAFTPKELPVAHDEAARVGVSRYLYEIGFLSLQR